MEPVAHAFEGNLGQSSFVVDPAATHAALEHVCIAGAISRHASVSPNAPAVTAGRSTINYSQLNADSNQLARYLASLGVGFGCSVALLLDRSARFVVAALAALKTGAAYIPIDPAYPYRRVKAILDEVKPTFMLTTRSLATARGVGGPTTLALDDSDSHLESFSTAPFGHAPGLQDVAYIIYTSGSTGRPKGVQIPHRGLTNLVSWHTREFNVTAADRASQLASPGFDAAVWEIWPYLCAGAHILIAPDEVRVDPLALRDWLISNAITISFAPTPLAERMIDLDWPQDAPLRVLLTGADILHSFPKRRLPFTLVNNYGPTECTVVASSCPVAGSPCATERPSIGRPIANVQVHIMDEHLQPVPDGSPGEICIAGACVGLGYVNAPELSRNQFVRNPFDSDPSASLYRTGDLGAIGPDGQIRFLGRMDEQVKIRGFRVEPAEIVSALIEHPLIGAAAVVPREAAGGEKQLVAYIVTHQHEPILTNDIQLFLARLLPEYMIPAIIVRLESLPLNANGKIDRQALPPPQSAAVRSDAAVVDANPFEERIAALLSSMLEVSEVGRNDNFFMLGGHSLLGTQLIARLRDAFGVELSLRALFSLPTVASLAAEVEKLVYARLESMTDEEAEKLLTALSTKTLTACHH